MTTDEAIAELLRRGVGDWVMFHEVTDLLRQADELESSERFVAQVKELLARVLSDRLMRIGSVERGKGFIPWEISTAEAIERAMAEWQDLPHPPSLGDVCWFENTNAEDDIGRRHLLYVAQGAVEPLDLPVGLGAVGAAVLFGMRPSAEGLVEQAAPVSERVVGQDPLDVEAAGGEQAATRRQRAAVAQSRRRARRCRRGGCSRRGGVDMGVAAASFGGGAGLAAVDLVASAGPRSSPDTGLQHSRNVVSSRFRG